MVWYWRIGYSTSGKPVPWEQWQNSRLQEAEGKLPSEVEDTPVHPSVHPSVHPVDPSVGLAGAGVEVAGAEDVGGGGAGDVVGAEQSPAPPPHVPAARQSASESLKETLYKWPQDSVGQL